MANASNFSFNDPLYLHPSDSPGISLVLDPLIATENYGVWHRAMKLALHTKNKVRFVTSDCKRPAANSPTLYQWERCNAVVLSWLLSSISKEIYYGLVYSTDASSVWADLKEWFDKICGSRIYALHREIVHFSQGSSTISVYFSKLRQLWDEYASLVILPSCACPTSTEYVKHDQHQRLIQFFMGLNESYGAIRSQILLMDPLPSVNQAYSLVCQEETHRNALASHPIADAPTTTFYSNSKRFDNVKCDNCNLPGHTLTNCFRLIGYPPGHKLHKKFPQEKSSKSAHHTLKVPVSNSPVSQAPSTESGSVTSPGVMFTPSQYDQILRLLAASPASYDVTANLAGTSNGLQDSQTCLLPTGSVRLPNADDFS